MINLKREFFRNSINKQTREAIFKQKRIVLQINHSIDHDPFSEKLNQLFKSEFTMCDINEKLQQLYHEYNLFPDRHLEVKINSNQIITQIKILGIKVAETKDQRQINEFYLSIKGKELHYIDNILPEIIRYCDYRFEFDPNTVEITNYCLWIMINLTLADECIDFLIQHTNLLNNLKKLLSSKFEVIVSRVLDLLFNITIEERACWQLLQDEEFEEAFIKRLQRVMPEDLTNKAASIIKNFCYYKGDLRKMVNFIYNCIRVESINGLIDVLPEESCLQFMLNYQAFCVKIFSQPLQSINFINYLSSNENDEVIELLVENGVVDQLLTLKKSHNQYKVYATFSNIADACQKPLRQVLYTIYEDYQEADLKVKMEMGYFVAIFIKNCDATYYQDLIFHGVVKLLLQYVQEIYDPKCVLAALEALETLSIDEHAIQEFEVLQGQLIMEQLNQTQGIIDMVQRIKRM